MRNPKERLQDILDAIEAIERHKPEDKSAFEKDELLQVWCLRHLQIIGEAARLLPETIRALAPQIPWQSVYAIFLSMGILVLIASLFGMQLRAMCHP